MNNFSDDFCCFLYDALQAEYFVCEEIVLWADSLILQCEAPKAWLICLSLIKIKEGRYSLFDEENGNLAEELQKSCCWQKHKNCFKGFLFAKYIEGRVSRNDLLDFYIDVTTNEDVLWEDLQPEMEVQYLSALEFLNFLRRDDVYAVAPWIFDYKSNCMM
ncbi:hypothetical protein [Vandammella animalimorsus]|uniref:hypothetical protein n=1 Tax=Vandammella animalimorsus TaxID=2029117 RepID=UPI0011785F64|nr:hypothetical protein [Vandammella animalimorsus]